MPRLNESCSLQAQIHICSSLFEINTSAHALFIQLKKKLAGKKSGFSKIFIRGVICLCWFRAHFFLFIITDRKNNHPSPKQIITCQLFHQFPNLIVLYLLVFLQQCLQKRRALPSEGSQTFATNLKNRISFGPMLKQVKNSTFPEEIGNYQLVLTQK